MAAKRSGQSKKKSKSKASAKKPAKRSATKKAAEPSSGDQRVAELQRIMAVMKEAGAVEVEMEDGRLRVRLKEDHPTVVAAVSPVSAASVVAVPAVAAAAAAPEVEDLPGEEFASPMVGTFYRAASPEAELFCQVGDSVSEDSTLCIIEAMKVMNEIKAELNGRIVAILVENGEPVEFGQPLFRIEKG
jgi:acetyl-CoA carboxylase biotin carboxyl carrier protein